MSTAQSDNLLDHALVYLRLGLVPIPCRTGRPLIPWRTFQERIPSEGEVRGMPWSQADAVAVVLGHEHPSLGGYWWVLDVEAYARQEAETWLDGARPEWRSSLVSRTQRDGRHIFCLARSPVRTARCPWGDLKGVGSLALVPPSRAHKPDATYDTYTWLSFGEPLLLEPGELPRVDEKAGAVTDRVPVRELLQHPIVEGTRNMALTRIAGALRRLGLSAEEVFATLEVINTTHCRPPLPSEEVATIARSSANWPAGAPPRHDDRGAAPGATGGDDGRAAGASPARWTPIPASALTATAAPDVPWIWRGYVAKGAISLIVGRPKVGKTSAIAALARAMGDDGPAEIAGEPVAPGRILVVSEEGTALWCQRVAQFRIGDHCHFLCRPFGKPDWATWRAFVEFLERYVLDEQIACLVLDTFGSLVPGDENDAAQISAVMGDLAMLVERTGVALVLTHHLRKAPGSEATAARGSSMLVGAADIIAELRRAGSDQDTRRTLVRYSRFDGYHETTVEWTGETYVPVDSASVERDRSTVVLQALVAAGTAGATVDEISEWTQLPRATVARLLGQLLEDGLANRTGSGRRGDGYRWHVTDQGAVSSHLTPIIGFEMRRKNRHSVNDQGSVSSHLTPVLEFEMRRKNRRSVNDPPGDLGQGEGSHVMSSRDSFSPGQEVGDGESPGQGLVENQPPGQEKKGRLDIILASSPVATPGQLDRNDFISSQTLEMSEMRRNAGTSAEPQNPHQYCEKTSHAHSAGGDVDENPHQYCEKTSHAPAASPTVGDGDSENPHQSCEKTSHCLVCGKPLVTVSGQVARYCSRSCQAKAYRLRREQTVGDSGDGRAALVGEQALAPTSPPPPQASTPADARHWSLAIRDSDGDRHNAPTSPGTGDATPPAPSTSVQPDTHAGGDQPDDPFAWLDELLAQDGPLPPFEVAPGRVLENPARVLRLMLNEARDGGNRLAIEHLERYRRQVSPRPGSGEPDTVAWARQLLERLERGEVTLGPVAYKPGHTVHDPITFLRVNLAEAERGDERALERLAQYRQAVDPASELDDDDAWAEQLLAVRHL